MKKECSGIPKYVNEREDLCIHYYFSYVSISYFCIITKLKKVDIISNFSLN
jgi:hypothetical protein